MTLKIKIASALVLGAMILGLTATPALAENNCTISGNGANSHNKCKQKVTNVSVTAKYQRVRLNNVVIAANISGLNSAIGNTGGQNNVNSGSSTTNTNITNNINN